MNRLIHPGNIQGTLYMPPSKSVMQRVCAGALLHQGKTTISNAGGSEDDQAALSIIQQLGAVVQHIKNQQIEIYSKGIHRPEALINCGESGLSARLFTPISALSETPITITGKDALLKRPMDSFSAVFAQLGLEVSHVQNKLPISIKGPMKLCDIEMDGALSSQFLTGLLFAFAFTAKQHYTISVKNLVSKPYIDLTIAVLKNFGIQIEHVQYATFNIEPYQVIKNDVVIEVEGDWSSAAFWLVAAAINGQIVIEGLDENSVQADKKIIDLLTDVGAVIKRVDNKITVEKSSLLCFEYDATDSPDLFPILAILATQCIGQSVIAGLSRLIHKESNRIDSIKAMLHSFGVQYSIQGNSLVIDGKQTLKGCTVYSNNDHRIAMAASVGAIIATDSVTIADAVCVAKSYPDFYKHLSAVGVNTQPLP